MKRSVEALLRFVLVVSVGPPLVPSRMMRVRFGCWEKVTSGFTQAETARAEAPTRKCLRKIPFAFGRPIIWLTHLLQPFRVALGRLTPLPQPIPVLYASNDVLPCPAIRRSVRPALDLIRFSGCCRTDLRLASRAPNRNSSAGGESSRRAPLAGRKAFPRRQRRCKPSYPYAPDHVPTRTGDSGRARSTRSRRRSPSRSQIRACSY